MLHQSFEQPASSEGAGGAAIGTLIEIAGNLDARFLPVGEALLALVETVDSVLLGLSEVRGAFTGDEAAKAVNALEQAAVSLLETPAAHAHRRNCFEELRGRVSALNSLSSELDRVLHVLEFYGLNVKIAAGGSVEFVDFADGMRQQLAAGRRELAEFAAATALLTRKIAGMRSLDADLTKECAALIPSVPEKLSDASKSLLLQQARVERVMETAAGIAMTIRTRIAAALGALQIGDSARQRIEHVAFACELMAGLETEAGEWRHAATARLAALCVAHLEAIAADFGDDAHRLLATLEDLLPDTSRLLETTRNDRGVTDSSAVIDGIESVIAESVNLTGQLNQANADAADILESVLETIDSLTTRVERVQDLGIEVGYMSVNANLRCRRQEEISRPVAVIAREIKSHSHLIDELSAKFVEGSATLRKLSDEIAHTGGEKLDIKAALEASLAALQAAADRTAQGIAKVDINCESIADRLRTAAGDLRESIAVIGLLDTVRLALADTAAGDDPGIQGDADHPLGSLLNRLFAVYTMAQERVIHDRFVLPGMMQAAACPPQAQGQAHSATRADDDDDGLFEDALF